MKRELNLQIHYNYIYNRENNTFSFTTKNDVEYKVSFIIDETFSSLSGHNIPHIYQIVIEKISEQIEPLDNQVFKTVEHIIRQFFNKTENSILYVCSDSDSKERKRVQVFNRWYQNSLYKDIIRKVDKTIRVEENIEIFTSFMYHKDNPNSEKIIEIYIGIEDLLNDEK